MGSSHVFGEAYAKAPLGAGIDVPRADGVHLRQRNDKRRRSCSSARDLQRQGFLITPRRARASFSSRTKSSRDWRTRSRDGTPQHFVDRMINGTVTLVINTPLAATPSSTTPTSAERRCSMASLASPPSPPRACIDAFAPFREGLQTFVTLQSSTDGEL